ncbi:serine/threonine protein kinase [Gimesia maris]|uniref:serine/threonine protein kinase n=1 Tax=Gimesia maris TaxID=122 RepID=UPI0032ED263A
MIKDYLESEDQDRLADLLVAWEESFDAGKEKSAVEIAFKFPHLIEPLQIQIESLKKTLWIKKDPGRKLTDREAQCLKTLSGIIADRYQIEELIGTGGYGQVYRATDLKLERPVAIKIGHSQFSSDLLMEEARRVARLKHPNIIAIHDVGQYKGKVFLVFEFAEGESLDKVILEHKMTVKKAVDLMISISMALHYAHEQSCIHRDIKPANIIIALKEMPLIADFGVAVSFQELQSGQVSNRETLAYMAPEQVADEVQLISPQTDIHALGVLLFELLTGELPYQSENEISLREEIMLRKAKRLRDVNQELPAYLETICSKCLEKHPEDRFKSAKELAQELHRTK